MVIVRKKSFLIWWSWCNTDFISPSYILNKASPVSTGLFCAQTQRKLQHGAALKFVGKIFVLQNLAKKLSMHALHGRFVLQLAKKLVYRRSHLQQGVDKLLIIKLFILKNNFCTIIKLIYFCGSLKHFKNEKITKNRISSTPSLHSRKW